MRGPSLIRREDRFALYQKLVTDPLSYSEKDLALFVQNGRMDARLAEVVTEHIRDYWWKYDPKSLNSRLRKQPWGSAIKPMLNQISEYCKATATTKAAFSAWARDAVLGLPDVPAQLYFIGYLKPRSKSQDREVSEALPSFSKAGYYAKDLMFNKGLPGSIKSVPTEPTNAISSADILKCLLVSEIRERTAELTLASVSAATGIDRTTISRIRSGKVGSLTADRLLKIVDSLKSASL